MIKNTSYKALGCIFIVGVMILFNCFLVSGVTWTVEGHGKTLSGSGSYVVDAGTMVLIGASDMYISQIIKHASATPTNAYVRWANGTVLGNVTFSTDTATFPTPIKLNAGGYYILAVDKLGASYTNYYLATSGNFPVVETDFTWANGTNGAYWDGALNDNFWSILSINYSLDYGSTATSINVSLISPANTTIINTDGSNFSVNLSMSGTNYSYQWKNVTYNLWYNNGTLFNSTLVNGLTGNNTNNTLFIDNFSLNTYIWNAYACYNNATFGNCSWSYNGNYTFTYVPFSNTGEVYSSSSFETKNETFYLNITTITGATKMGAFLVYNGTSYAASHTCVGSTCQVWREIDIPLMTSTGINENKSFYWQITIFGTFGTSTSYTTTHNQNVSNIVFNNCVPGYNNTVNFTIYNETDNSLINAGFSSTFNYWLGKGTVKDSYNYSGFGYNNYLFCINHNQSFITSSYILINSTTNSRIYQFVKEIYTNITRIQRLYIPDDSVASDIIIEVKNQGLIPQKDIIVNISRYYPATNTYRYIENQVTDEYGQIIARLIQNDVKYKFEFYNSDNTLLKTSDLVTVICRSSICVIPFIIETNDDYLDRYNNISLFDNQLEFDNTTNIFTYSWDDQTGESATHRLVVIRYSFNESEVVCNVTSTTTVSSLTCNVGNNPASYVAQTFRTVNGDFERRITYLEVIVGDYSSTFGVEGLFWVFVLLMICIGIGIYDPKVGAVVYGAGFIVMGLIKIIYMPVPVFFANTLLVIIFIWAVKT